ncbi:MAG TPA: TIGR02266 family protein [Archangium sp.]|nr:TIGR02266 family protein [Archangium sp.]
MTMKTAEAAEMSAVAQANRRAHERVTATFDVRFPDTEDAARALRAYSLNLSAGGLCLRTRRSYDVGAHVRLQMTVSGEDFDLEGIISWVRDDAEAIGVRFIGVSEEDQVRLQRVVASFKR